MSESLLERDAIIYHEMMAHVPLFTHRKPHHVAILNDDDQGILREVSKHATVTHCHASLEHIEPASLDILIVGGPAPQSDFAHYFSCLHADGILIQLCESPFQLSELKSTLQKLKTAGFHDSLPLQLPGWRSAVMAIKYGTIKRPREKDIFNKSFVTRYYNFDVHKAAFAIPEFMRLELEIYG